MQKPEEILNLEKEIKRNLKRTFNIEVLRNEEEYDLYLLDNMDRVIGLNINRLLLPVLPDLKAFSNLEILSLCENTLQDISELKTLEQLRILNLNNNNVQSISGIEKLTHLEVLTARENKIDSIEALKDLRYLKILDIAHNEVVSLLGLEGLINLKELDISFNKISNLVNLQSLVSLQKLYSTNNQITSLADLPALPNLKVLDLRNNAISNIYPLISYARKGVPVLWGVFFLEGINLSGNPLEKPLIDLLINRQQSAIIRHLERLASEGLSQIYEAKITFVGEGASGKTSLQKRLMNADAPLPEENTRTKGINIESWAFDRQHPEYVAHIWDFGGQDVYYPVHRFFLTEQSVYVLMASTRNKQHNFEYWIPTIFQFGGASPVIIAQTCHEGNSEPWNELSIYLSSPNFNIIKTGTKPYYEINLPAGNKGLDAIKSIISEQVRGLKHFGKSIPKSWLPVREAIAADQTAKSCISFEEFEKFCHKINQEKFSDPVEVQDLTHFFHLLGIILWYRENSTLKNWVILQPEWAMNAVYKIIDDETIQERNGHITAGDFERLWQEDCYKHRHEVLRNMLQIFKIAFPKKTTPQDYIMPARMPSIPAEKRWNADRDTMQLEYHFDFMPKALVNQLSAGLNRYIQTDTDVWNNAVNFIDPEHLSTAQVFEEFHNRRLFIKAHGKDARGLVKLITNELKDILEDYKGVSPDIMVPCRCSTCEKGETSEFFSYRFLLEKRKDRDYVRCKWSDGKQFIDKLLYNVDLPNPAKEKETFKKNQHMFRELIDILPELVQNKQQIVLYAQICGLSRQNIDMDGNPTIVWGNVLQAAINNNWLYRLVAAVYKDYPDNTQLEEILSRLHGEN